jgi:hypothetical protein
MTGTGTQVVAAKTPPPEIPLPPAIYLFGNALRGAFWLACRKSPQSFLTYLGPL